MWRTSAAAFALALLAPAMAADAPRATLAAREGEVVWYTAMNTSDTEPLRRRFEQDHPGVKLVVLRQPGEKVRMRILNEAQAGRFLWDVVSFNALDMDGLERAHMLADYRSPETASGYPPGAVQDQGRWTAIYVRQYVIGYNTRLVARGDAPRDWPDLLAPRWKGKLALDVDEVEWYAGMVDAMGRDKGTAFMAALARQSPQFRRGHSLLTSLLVAGDFPLAVVHIAEIEEARKSGAPVDWVRTLDPIVTSPSEVAISARAPHPNAARLFVDFLLSAEGQGLIASRGRLPARTDAGGQPRASLKVHYIKASLARDFERYEREYTDTFLKGRNP